MSLQRYLQQLCKRFSLYVQIAFNRAGSVLLYNVSLFFVPSGVVNAAYLLLLIQQFLSTIIFFKLKANLIHGGQNAVGFFCLNCFLAMILFGYLLVDKHYCFSQYWPLVLTGCTLPFFVNLFSFFELEDVELALKLEAQLTIIASFCSLLVLVFLSFMKIEWIGVLLLRFIFFVLLFLLSSVCLYKDVFKKVRLNMFVGVFGFESIRKYFDGFEFLLICFLFQYYYFEIFYMHFVPGWSTKFFLFVLNASSAIVAIAIRKVYVSRLGDLRAFKMFSMRLYLYCMVLAALGMLALVFFNYYFTWFVVALFLFVGISLVQTLVVNVCFVFRTMVFSAPLLLCFILGVVYENLWLFAIYSIFSLILFSNKKVFAVILNEPKFLVV